MVETRFYVLLIALLTVLVASAPLTRVVDPELVSSLTWGSVFLAGAYAVARTVPSMVLAGLLALAAIATDALTYDRVYGEQLALISALTDLFVMLFATGVLLYRMVAEETVTEDTVRGGICVYLMIGFLFVPLFAITEILLPGSFQVSQAALESVGPGEYGRFPALVYYSFVTLTTLGYGDVTPVTPEARGLATLEAVIGQLYVAVFVARLVGMHLSQRGASGDPA